MKVFLLGLVCSVVIVQASDASGENSWFSSHFQMRAAAAQFFLKTDDVSCGDRVFVKRHDGSYAPGLVVDVDGEWEQYTVQYIGTVVALDGTVSQKLIKELLYPSDRVGR